MSPTSRVSSAKKAYDYIRGELLIDPRSHGSFINEQAVADDIGISRTPVREALRRLASEGLVEQIPNRGTMIPIITRKQINDIMDLRIMLEIFAATCVIRNESSPGEVLTEIIEQQEKMAAHADVSRIKEFVALDQKFHATILEYSDNSELARAYERVSVRQWMIGTKSLFRVERWPSVIEEHRKIKDAIASGDVDAVEVAVREHLSATRDSLLAEYTR